MVLGNENAAKENFFYNIREIVSIEILESLRDNPSEAVSGSVILRCFYGINIYFDDMKYYKSKLWGPKAGIKFYTTKINHVFAHRKGYRAGVGRAIWDEFAHIVDARHYYSSGRIRVTLYRKTLQKDTRWIKAGEEITPVHIAKSIDFTILANVLYYKDGKLTAHFENMHHIMQMHAECGQWYKANVNRAYRYLMRGISLDRESKKNMVSKLLDHAFGGPMLDDLTERGLISGLIGEVIEEVDNGTRPWSKAEVW
jgi:hypothetical protein